MGMQSSGRLARSTTSSLVCPQRSSRDPCDSHTPDRAVCIYAFYLIGCVACTAVVALLGLLRRIELERSMELAGEQCEQRAVHAAACRTLVQQIACPSAQPLAYILLCSLNACVCVLWFFAAGDLCMHARRPRQAQALTTAILKPVLTRMLALAADFACLHHRAPLPPAAQTALELAKELCHDPEAAAALDSSNGT